MSTDTPSVVLIVRDASVYIMTHRDGSIQCFENDVEGVRYFEKGYNDSHNTGYQQSMSACMHYISFQPRIISLSTEQIETILLGEPPWSNFSLGSIAGTMSGIKCEGPEAKEIYDRAIAPNLT